MVGARDDDKSVEIQFPLDVHDGWPPVEVESLWCVPVDVAKGRYRVDNVPLFAVGVAWRDLVHAEREAGGPLTFKDVIESSGHSALRVLVDPDADPESVAIALTERGAGVQRTPIEALLTVDLAPDFDAAPLLLWLDEAEAAGLLEWEEGALADAHRPTLH